MVLLGLIKESLNPENPFGQGHPVQLLLWLFNKFNQESIIFLMDILETTLPSIPNESKKLTDKAEKIFEPLYEQHQYYENATDEEKEHIEQEIKKKQKELKQDETGPEIDDIKQNKTESKSKPWMDRKQFQNCDLHFRKASKLSPKCIKCYLKHIIFLFKCNKISMANTMFEKALTIIHNLKNSKNTKTKKKSKKHSNSHNNKMNALTTKELNTVETLITFYFGYLYYMNDDINNFNIYLKKCLDLEPNNIGIRCQYIVCSIIQIEEYEKAYIYIMQTLQLLKERENEYIKNKKMIIEKEKNMRFTTMDIINHYRVICGMGAALIRLVFSIDYKMVIEHLQFVIEYDESNIGIIKYCLSYALYKDGQYDLSNEFYNKFVQYINKKKLDALKRTKDKNNDSAMDNAISQLNMDYFVWNPNTHKDNISEMLDLFVDLIVVCIIVGVTYIVFGYMPHFGNNIIDWFTICVMLIISCVLCTPSLGVLLIAVSLPPYSGSEFNYWMFATKWLCISAGLLFIYRVVIGGVIPTNKWF